MVPGISPKSPRTKWCGKGNISSPQEELGSFRGTDKCCREHDHAVDFIEPRSTKYGIDNTHVWPMYARRRTANCEDDNVFFHCLLNDQSPSRMASACVGFIYFNVIKLKCFKQTYNITCADSKE
ncbi:phospholipase A2-like [Haemaphysalis longicornis]